MKVQSWFVGEFLGAFLLVFFGCGSVCAAVFTGAQVGIVQIAIVWGVGIAVAIYLTSSLSGAHLNPAVTIAFAVFSGFPLRRVPGYLVAQLLGAFFAAMVLHGIFGSMITDYESSKGLTRGAAGSEASAMVYGEYFPNPGGEVLTPQQKETITLPRAFFIECVGTAVLLLVICGLTDRKNKGRSDHLNPILIGLTVTLLISLLAPLTQAGFNPARDLGPRLFSALAGWKEIPFTTNGSGWWLVYLVAPTCGGLLGAGLHRVFLARAYESSADPR